MKFFQFAISLLAAGLLLTGCKDAAEKPAAAKAAPVPVSVPAIAAEARGFTVGSPMSVRTVYVFFDPQCPHCAALWNAAKPLKSQAKFIWIPVALMGKTSEAQGATMLAAADPVAAMEENENSVLAKKGGISAAGDYEKMKPAIAKNTELLTRFGFTSIPTVVGLHAQSGAVVSREGSMPTAQLAALLGLQVPAGN
jgi:thiol:disulfide interchange protein DsbG